MKSVYFLLCSLLSFFSIYPSAEASEETRDLLEQQDLRLYVTSKKDLLFALHALSVLNQHAKYTQTEQHYLDVRVCLEGSQSSAHDSSCVSSNVRGVDGAALDREGENGSSLLRKALRKTNIDRVRKLWFAGVSFDQIETDLEKAELHLSKDEQQKKHLLKHLLLLGIFVSNDFQEELDTLPGINYHHLIAEQKSFVIRDLQVIAQAHGLDLSWKMAEKISDFVVTNFEQSPFTAWSRASA